ncbi:hypothetical protein BDV24DRAFT_161943 [Aspergillus arachidicola]|uniref:FAD-binding PCMH-type domain-containing protein n=1 Tax=Aspergillus arachidicola TaxID=656916 RepID=A0A5N6YHZ3_9EURO|nr:hypothetical protein BDV24DRAFT_161943 [Aspergillus arachidicola]
MGNAPSSPAHQCLLSAVGNDSSLLAFPSQPFYESAAANPYNLNWPVYPAAVASPKTSEQVADIVKCAVEYDHKVQAKSGGRSYANFGLGGVDGEVAIDMKHFQQFSLDDSTYIATVGPGLRLSDMTQKLGNEGRAMPYGEVPEIGVGGHFTIGGLGTYSRLWGSALDNIVEAEVVLANSSIVRASKDSYPDVFFAIRGAAASFGIVTEFKVKTYPSLSETVQIKYEFSIGSSAERANLYMAWQELCAQKNLTRKFDTRMVVTQGTMIILAQFHGTKEEYERLGFDKALRASNAGNVVVLTDPLASVGYDIEKLATGIVGGTPINFYEKSLSFEMDKLPSNSTAQALFHYLDTADKGTATWFVVISIAGGATNDVPVDATAYAQRNVMFYVESFGINLLGRVSQTTVDFLDGINNLVNETVPGSDRNVYPGFVDPFLPNAQEAYWGPNLPKLQKIKAAIDPNDVFHNPQSVRPAGKGT